MIGCMDYKFEDEKRSLWFVWGLLILNVVWLFLGGAGE